MKIRVLLLVVFVVGLAAGPLSAQEKVTAEEVIARYIEGAGGRTALEKVRDRMYTGTAEARTEKGSFQVWSKAPDKIRSRIEIGRRVVEEGFDGKVAWRRESGGVRILTGRDAELTRRGARFQQLLDYEGKGEKPVYLGTKEIDAGDVHIVVFSYPDGSSVIYHFSVSDFRLVKVSSIHVDAEGMKQEIQQYFSDHRKVSGVLEPFEIRQASARSSLRVDLDEYRHNQGLEDAFFGPPPTP